MEPTNYYEYSNSNYLKMHRATGEQKDRKLVSIKIGLCRSRIRWLFHILLFLSLSSCYTSKQVNYLQSDKSSFRIPVLPTIYKVQPNDVLSVRVQSRDPEQSAFFNITTANNIDIDPASLFLNGYTVDAEGMINLAIVGELKVSELTVPEIRDLVQAQIDEYLLNALVSVKLTSFKVSVLGDVKNPGINYIYNTQVNIFEALSAAGDLNLSAKRENVKLIRQEGDISKVINLDLTEPSIINSPYYFLHPNDVIYVDTSKQNIIKNNMDLFSLILSAITTTVLVLSFTSK